MKLRFLTHPLVAFPIWAANLLLWHLPFAYQGALHHYLPRSVVVGDEPVTNPDAPLCCHQRAFLASSVPLQ